MPQNKGAQYILAIDQGTTGTKVVLFDTSFRCIAEASHEFAQHFPEPGWVEHDLPELWESVEKGIAVVLKSTGVQPHYIGITNQRETICAWDKVTHEPLTRAIVWQDRRTAQACEEWEKAGFEKFIQEETGLLLDPYFSASKMAWLLKNNERVQNAAKQERLAFGTVDSYLISKLTSGSTFVTEPSNASRTMLYSLHENKWSERALLHFGISSVMLPKILPSFGDFGVTVAGSSLKAGIPITGVLGDQQAALFGQKCLHPGSAKCTYGTGAFLLMNTGNVPQKSTQRLLTTVAWQDSDGSLTYALEGSAFIAGAAVQWFRDGLGCIETSAEIEALAASVPDANGVRCIPAFTGLGCPYWDAHVQAALLGITRGTTKAHIARAILEGVALQVGALVAAMERDGVGALTQLRVDGGMARNDFFLQLQADILQRTVVRASYADATVLGAVFAASKGAGLLKETTTRGVVDDAFMPQKDAAWSESMRVRWETDVGWLRSINV